MPVSVIPVSVIPDSTLARYAQVRYARFPAPETNLLCRNALFALVEAKGSVRAARIIQEHLVLFSDQGNHEDRIIISKINFFFHKLCELECALMKAIFRNDNASNGNQSDVRVEIRRGQEVNNPVLECTLQIGYMVLSCQN